MGEAVVIAPTIVVMITAIGRNIFLDEFFQILNQARFMFDGRERRGGAGDEKRRRASANFRPLNMLFELGGNVDDGAETSGGFGDLLGFNRDHASEVPSALVRWNSFCLPDQFFGAFQCRIDLCRFLAAGLSEIRAATAAAADHGR